MLGVQLYLYAMILSVVAILVLRFRRSEFSVFEPGVTFGAFAFLYSVIPLLAFSVVGDISTHPEADARLDYQTASLEAISRIGWLHLLFFACFVLAYAGLRMNVRPLRIQGFRAKGIDIGIGVALLIGCKAAVWLALRYFDVSADNYLETYIQLDALPLLVRQVLTHLSALAITFSVFLCVGLMSRKEYRWIVPVWLGFEAVLLLGNLGSRTTLFTICLASLASYHYLVRRISFSLVMMLLGMALIAFASVGAFRDLGSRASDISDFLTAMLIRNEFTTVFINAIDIQRLRDAGMTDSIFPQFYFSDLVNIIPRQFLETEKLDLSSWYVRSFYPEYSALGGAYAFGVVSEAIVGYGYIEAGIRAVLLGISLAVAHAWTARRTQPSLWTTTLYVWLLVLSFRIFRGSTFVLLPVFVLDFLPAYILFRIVRACASTFVQIRQKRLVIPSSS